MRIRPSKVMAVGIANRTTTVVWDRATGQPLTNAIVWQDTRTKELCDNLAAGGIDRFRAATGLPLATYFSRPEGSMDTGQYLRCRRLRRSGRRAVRHDRHLADVVAERRAGGGRACDRCDQRLASSLMNLATLDWDDTLLVAMGIPRRMLPAIVPSSSPDIGRTRTDGPLGAAIPISGIVGDQQAALVGQACFRPGECKNTYGTGCFMLLNTGTQAVQSRSGLLTTVAYQMAGSRPVYALEGSVAIAGRWYSGCGTTSG